MQNLPRDRSHASYNKCENVRASLGDNPGAFGSSYIVAGTALKTNDYAVFKGYRDYLKDRAMEHAATEWKRFQKMLSDGSHLPAVNC